MNCLLQIDRNRCPVLLIILSHLKSCFYSVCIETYCVVSDMICKGLHFHVSFRLKLDYVVIQGKLWLGRELDEAMFSLTV